MKKMQIGADKKWRTVLTTKLSDTATTMLLRRTHSATSTLAKL